MAQETLSGAWEWYLHVGYHGDTNISMETLNWNFYISKDKRSKKMSVILLIIVAFNGICMLLMGLITIKSLKPEWHHMMLEILVNFACDNGVMCNLMSPIHWLIVA